MSRQTRQTHRFWLVIAFTVLLYFANMYRSDESSHQTASTTVEQLFAHQLSDRQVTLYGTVSKLLAEDDKGSRHQRFIVTLPSGQTVLIAHNIDLAPRLQGLQVGDKIAIYGEYEWNKQGGIVHWTHHDPDNVHPHGWIRWQRKLYQ